MKQSRLPEKVSYLLFAIEFGLRKLKKEAFFKTLCGEKTHWEPSFRYGMKQIFCGDWPYYIGKKYS